MEWCKDQAGFAQPRRWPALVVLTLITRLPALIDPRAIDDEAVYGVVARVMLAGGLPYRDAIERKPPLLFAVYWAVFRIFGAYNWLALHAVALVWVLATMAGLFVLAQRLGGHRAGLLAAGAYALVQPWATAKNLAFNGEVLMNLPLVCAYALILGVPARRSAAAGIAGVLLGAAFLLKQPAAIAALPLGCYLLTAPCWQPTARWRGAILQAAALTAGFAATLGAAAAILQHYGLLDEAWYWTVADHDVPHVFWQHAAEHSALFVLFALPLVLPLTAWPALRRAWSANRAEWFAVLGWLAVSVIGAAAGGRFYPHYYIQIVPPLAVLAAIAYARPGQSGDSPPARRISLRFAGRWLIVAAVISLAVQIAQLWAERAPSAAADYLRRQARPGDRLFVWGQHTAFYIDAGLLPASRYIASFPLTGYIFGGALPGRSTRDRIVPGAWRNLGADFARHAPQFIIDTQTGAGDPYRIANYPWLAQRVAGNYRAVASFPDGVVYRAIASPPKPA